MKSLRKIAVALALVASTFSLGAVAGPVTPASAAVAGTTDPNIPTNRQWFGYAVKCWSNANNGNYTWEVKIRTNLKYQGDSPYFPWAGRTDHHDILSTDWTPLWGKANIVDYTNPALPSGLYIPQPPMYHFVNVNVAYGPNYAPNVFFEWIPIQSDDTAFTVGYYYKASSIATVNTCNTNRMGWLYGNAMQS